MEKENIQGHTVAAMSATEWIAGIGPSIANTRRGEENYAQCQTGVTQLRWLLFSLCGCCTFSRSLRCLYETQRCRSFMQKFHNSTTADAFFSVTSFGFVAVSHTSALNNMKPTM